MEAKDVYQGISRLLEASSARELPKPVKNVETSSVAENGELPKMENGETPDANANESEAINADEVNEGTNSQTEQENTNLEKAVE